MARVQTGVMPPTINIISGPPEAPRVERLVRVFRKACTEFKSALFSFRRVDSRTRSANRSAETVSPQGSSIFSLSRTS